MGRVSVIIPVRNGEATVARAIDSALAQQLGETEVVVINDGSTDATRRILESYGGRIRVVNHDTARGPAASRNAGVSASQGEYLAFLDADDVWRPGMLPTMVAALEANPPVVLAFCDVVPVDEGGGTLQASLIPAQCARAPSMAELLQRWWPIIPSAVVMRRATFELCGGFDEAFTTPGWEDPYLWLLVREHGQFHYVAEPLVLYRMPPPMERLVKYGPGCATFVRRVRERYGAAASELIEEVKRARISALGYEGLRAMSRGDKREARRAFVLALRYKPYHFRTVLRLLRTFLPRAAARALTGRTRLVFSSSGDTACRQR